MVAWTQLLLPALVATVLVFVASSVIHMVLQLHNSDYRKLPDEEALRAALAADPPPPGQYIVPHCLDPKELEDPAMRKKFDDGPVAVLFVRDNGQTKLGPFLAQWVGYVAVLSLLVGYVARAAVPAGADYLTVFQLVGATAWLGYAWQSPSDSIWKGKPWAITFRGLFDGLVYAALTAGVFAWLWP